MNSLVIIAILLERVAIAAIGLLAAIYGQVGWSVFMGVVLVSLLISTSIKVKGGKE